MKRKTRPGVKSMIAVLAAGLSAVGPGGCANHSAVVNVPVPTSTAAPNTAAIEDPAFVAGKPILDGIETAPGVDDWAVGDQVLLGIRARKRGAETVRFLLIELTSELDKREKISFTAAPKGREKYEFTSSAVITKLSLFDDSGKLITESRGRFPQRLLGCGLYDGVASSVDHPEMRGKADMTEGLSLEEYDRTMRGWLTIFSFSGSMGKKGMFRDMLYDLVARPTWLAMLLNPTVSLGFGEEWPRCGEQMRVGGAELETIDVPLECLIAGKRAAHAHVTAARPVAPLSLCGGVVGVIALNGDDADVTMEVRLLAAKRGSGGKGLGE